MVPVPVDVHIPTLPIIYVALGAGFLGIGVTALMMGAGVKVTLPPEVLALLRTGAAATVSMGLEPR